MLGCVAGGVEFFAEVGDVGLDDVGVVLPVVVVEVLEELCAGDDDAGAEHEVLEDAVLGGGEIDEGAGAMDGLLEGVELDVGDTQGGVGCSFAAANEGFGAGEEFAEVEGLAEVVVGAGVEEVDGGVLVGYGGEDEDGGTVAALRGCG